MSEATEPYRHHHRDGSLWIVGQLRDGKADGYWEWFRKDGSKLRSGHFAEGVQVGDWTTYDKAGKLYKVTTIKQPDPGAVTSSATLPR
ncbi:hypothetical protein SLT36_12660 [Aminobacter sp. BA135]|uniref:toxin-antitoxin system YwqK family antitoxin n=1 Tax=Aminobacter sp. BA135 TaxID=537596 RepID=UPI003D7A5D9B